MILKQVKQNGIEVMIVILLITIALSVSMFMNQTLQFVSTPNNGSPLFNTLYSYIFNGRICIASQITSLVLLAIETFMLILLNSDFELTRAKPSLFMIVYIPLALSFVPNNTLLPEQIANILITLGLIKTLACHNMNNASYTFFDAGLFFGIAVLFCLPAIIMLAVGLAAMIIFRPFKVKEYMVFFLGIFTPILFYLAAYYLAEGTLQPIYEFIDQKLKAVHAPTITYNEIIYISISTLLLLIASMLILKEYPKYNLFSSQAYRVMFIMFLAVCSISITPYFGVQTMRMALLPTAMLCITVFQDLKPGRMSDIFFSVFILTYMAMQALWYRL